MAIELSSVWVKILSDYNNAKDALWCPKCGKDWRRKEEIGRYHMWKAYHSACEAEPKEYLLFARILAMMADESRISMRDYDRYHKFIKPAVEAYGLAEKAGQHPTGKEVEKIRFAADSINYVLDCENAPYADHVKLIKGYERLDGFSFHDSKPVWFEHNEKTARLKLKYDGMIATLLFEGIVDIHVDGDPLTDWIIDFYCYPCFHNKELLKFDVGFYVITCSEILVEKIGTADEER